MQIGTPNSKKQNRPNTEKFMLMMALILEIRRWYALIVFLETEETGALAEAPAAHVDTI